MTSFFDPEISPELRKLQAMKAMMQQPQPKTVGEGISTAGQQIGTAIAMRKAGMQPGGLLNKTFKFGSLFGA